MVRATTEITTAETTELPTPLAKPRRKPFDGLSSNDFRVVVEMASPHPEARAVTEEPVVAARLDAVELK